MRRVLPCLMLLLALASPAGARQSQSAAVINVLPPPIPLAAQRQGADPMQCKAACARLRYFCAANSDDDSCAPQWAQCTARCTATYSRTGQ